MERRIHKKGLLVFVFVLIGFIIFPLSKASAKDFNPFTSFGGKIKAYSPTNPACYHITVPLCALTSGAVCLNVETITVDDVQTKKIKTIGLLRVDGFVPPFLTTLFDYKKYQVPNTWVLGNSLDLCGLCSKLGELIPGSELYNLGNTICKIPVVDTILNAACRVIGGSCQLTNSIHYLGTGKIPDIDTKKNSNDKAGGAVIDNEKASGAN